ncbi:hypothetical protein [Streptosporangium sp. KLBMP 9127]|nr:hypothetical protein [Streptosporangium sp. KLBMP 9127]
MTVGTTSSARVLERRYRRLLVAYPPDYRSGHGEELIATLMETAEPLRSAPSPTESAALVAGGLRTRMIQAARGPAWDDGIHLGVTALAVACFASLVPYAGSIPLWVALSGVTTWAVIRGRVRLALPLVVLVATKVCAIAVGYPWLDETLLPIFPDSVWGGPALFAGGGPIAPVAAYAVIFLGLATLAVRAGPSPKRSWRWWPAVPLLAGANTETWSVAEPTGTPGRIALEITLLLLAVWAAHVNGDPRWAIAAGVYLAAEFAELAEGLAYATRQDLAHWGLLVFLTAAAVAVTHRARRHILL